MSVPLLGAGFILLEIWLVDVVAGWIGGLPAFLLLLAGLFLGGMVAKRAGLAAWRGLVASLQPGATQGTGRTAADSGLAMAGGLLLMLPGYASDGLGLLCLFPPTRVLLRKAANRMFTGRPARGPGSLGDLFQQTRDVGEQVRIHRPDGKVIQGEVVEPATGPDTTKPGTPPE